MRSFKEVLKETSLSRVFSHVSEKRPVAIISAFKDEKDIDENISRNKQMGSKVRNAGFGFFYIEGYWTNEEIQEKEDSLFIIGYENDNGRLKGLIRKLVKEYDQDAAVFKPEDSKEAFLINNDMTETSIGTFKANQKDIADSYSKIKGKDQTFVFTETKNHGTWFTRLAERNGKKFDYIYGNNNES